MKIAVSALLLMSVHIFGGWAAATQDTTLSNKIRSAFLLNFARFVDWPPASFSSGNTPFTLCASEKLLPGVLETTIRGETVNGRTIELRRVSDVGEIKGCHLLYISGAHTPVLLRSAAAANALTVGETPDFLKQGGTIRFVEVANRVRFEISLNAADRAQLRVSSRLLRLADIVQGAP
jgi:hypothetical protein